MLSYGLPSSTSENYRVTASWSAAQTRYFSSVKQEYRSLLLHRRTPPREEERNPSLTKFYSPLKRYLSMCILKTFGHILFKSSPSLDIPVPTTEKIGKLLLLLVRTTGDKIVTKIVRNNDLNQPPEMSENDPTIHADYRRTATTALSQLHNILGTELFRKAKFND